MSETRSVYLGTDCGATTSKVGAVFDDGSAVTTRLLQYPTKSADGPEATVMGWVEAASAFLEHEGIGWDRVKGAGLATPGPFRRYGVLARTANLPESFDGFDVHSAYQAALSNRAGRPIPLIVGNDGDLAGVGEAQRVRGSGTGSVVLLAPGSGLGCAYIDTRGLPLSGDTLAGMEAGHMPAALHLLGVPSYPCGCGRTWGCIELYTCLSGLPYLLEARLADFPDHPLSRSDRPMKERALALREFAQQGDDLARSLFDFQARALGIHLANLTLALDPSYVVIGGGLMDPGATTVEFRERYLRIVREAADPYLFPNQRANMKIVPASLGDLSQSIGAALVALYRDRDQG